ncbi:MAG: hypothetical protein KDD47_16410 [Acidobacteria bacterium]|nr:hypothetical protein [Acidobacteriota bacterium]
MREPTLPEEPGKVEPPPGASVEAEGEKARGKIFPCPSCGADLTFHIGQQNLRCPFCGYSQELAPGEGEVVAEQDLAERLRRLVELRRQGLTETLETETVECEACGAAVEFKGPLTSTECAYCGSPVQRQNVHRSQTRMPVDGVVPFQVERRQAQENLDRWLKSRWFAPNAFKKRGLEGKFNGVYLPFWTFDAMAFCRYRGERGDERIEVRGSGNDRRRHTVVDWSPASGQFQRFFDDLVVAANRSLSRAYLAKLEPWPLEMTRPFTEELLAGYLAQTYEVGLEEAFPLAEREMEAWLRSEAARRIGGDRQRIHHLEKSFSALTYKHLLMPVWLMSYRYKGRPYQVLVNAASGEVFGERPYSVVKIVLLILAVLLVGYLFS